jgi:hypothetical protein
VCKRQIGSSYAPHHRISDWEIISGGAHATDRGHRDDRLPGRIPETFAASARRLWQLREVRLLRHNGGSHRRPTIGLPLTDLSISA